MSPKVKAIILVGGPSLGTRFRPLSLTVPKPLFPIGGAPLLYHHLRACSNVPNLLEVLLIGFFPHHLLEEFIQNTSLELNLKIRYLQEETRLGTAGGIQRFQHEILDGLNPNDSILILHGDILCNFPLNQLLEEHNKNNHFCTILTKKYSTLTYHNFGCIVADKNTSEVLHYAEKPETFVNDLVNCGVYAFQLELFEHLSTALKRKESEKNSSIYDIYKSFEYQSDSEITIQIEQDILRELAGKQKIYTLQTSDYWLQIKHPMSALKGSQLLFDTNTIELQEKKPGKIIGNVFIHKEVEVDPSAVLGPNVTICKGVRIGPGVRIRNSIILDNVEIKDHACIINSIIGWNSIIAQWDRIEGTIVDDNNSNDAYDSTGYGGITIIAEGVKTGPEICIRNCIVLPHKELYQNYSNSILL